MVNYKVRTFYEKDTGTAGADVIIYSDQGDVIDTLLITTESTYNDLIEQLEGIDERYLDRNDVLQILQNTTNEIVNINATSLNGLSSDQFARYNHNHDSVYAKLPHVNTLSTEGVAGHTKIINNVSRDAFVTGEALSAYQGKLLSDRINGMQPKLNDTGWDNIPYIDSSVNLGPAGNVSIFRCRRYGKLAILEIFGNFIQPLAAGNPLCTLKSEFRPNSGFFSMAYWKGGITTLAIAANGTISFGNKMESGNGIRIRECYFIE